MKKKIIALVVVLVLAVCGFAATYTVAENEYA